MKQLAEGEKSIVKKRMDSIEDEVGLEKDQQVNEISYYKEVEIAGVRMNLYYAVSEDKEGKKTYQLFNGSQKIGEGNKTGKQITIDPEFLQELEKKMKVVDPEYSLDEYGGEKIKLQQKDLQKNEASKMSELEDKEKQDGIILPGLEDKEEPQQEKKVEEKMKLTRVQRISGKEACAVLGNDTQNYKDMYIGYSEEAQTFVAVGVNGDEMKLIDGVKSYEVKAGGQEGKEEYFLTGEIDPTKGGIAIVDNVGSNNLDVSVHRVNEKGQCEITQLDDFGHNIEKKGIDVNGDEKINPHEEDNTMKEDDEDRGEERVPWPRHYQ